MYKVGTRVKKVRRTNREREIVPVGSTGIITYVGLITSPNYDVWECKVKYDGYAEMVGLFRCLEPIIPEGSNVPSEASIHELLDSKFYEKENCNV